MSQFLKNLFVFAMVFFIAEKIFYPFIWVSPSLEVDQRLEKIITGEVNKEIIVMGSSRGARNIIASRMEDSLHVSAYNLSYPGSDIEFHKFLLEALIRFNKNPRKVLLAVDDPSELLASESIKFRLDLLYPLAGYNYINDAMIARGEKPLLSKILILSRINRQNFDIKEKHFSTLDTIIGCGSMPISFQRKKRAFKYDSSSRKYQIQNELKNKVNAFLEFRDLCVKNNIELILVFSPNYAVRNYDFEKRLRALTYSKARYYVYDSTNTAYRNKSYYYDESHLQKKGAVIFTNELIGYLKKEL